MTTMKLTDRWIRSGKCRPRSGRTQDAYWDTETSNFGVRVTVSGSGDRTTRHRAFIIRYRVDDRRRYMTIGAYPDMKLKDARVKAQGLLNRAKKGEDPAAEEAAEKAARRAAPTFGDLAELYIEKYAKRNKRSWEEDQRQLGRDLLPAWKDRKAAEITKADVLDVLDAIVDRGAPIQANRTRVLVSGIYNFGMDRGKVETNPVSAVKRPAPEESRERVLAEDEIRRLWKALDKARSERPSKDEPKAEDDPGITTLVAAIFRLILLTAQREIEVASMRWEDLDGDWWTVPADVVKNKRSHRVPLSPQVLAILEAIRPDDDETDDDEKEPSPWVFPTPLKRGGHISAKSLPNAARRIGQASKVEDWTPHDLRRTAATMMASRKYADPHTVGLILGHTDSRGVTAVYDRASYDDDKRRALVAWGAEVERIVSGKAREAKIAARIG